MGKITPEEQALIDGTLGPNPERDAIESVEPDWSKITSSVIGGLDMTRAYGALRREALARVISMFSDSVQSGNMTVGIVLLQQASQLAIDPKVREAWRNLYEVYQKRHEEKYKECTCVFCMAEQGKFDESSSDEEV